MAIFNANEMIRAIRKNAGLSQEEFCEGICSTQALSNIENGKNGISPITFEKLTARANMNVRPFPSFASVKDYNCFMDLHRAEFFVESWQFSLAYEELDKVEQNHFAGNKYYYQKWILLHCKILALSENCNYEKLLENACRALEVSISRDVRHLPEKTILSITELELYIVLADSYIGLFRIAEAKDILSVLKKLVDNIKISAVPGFLISSDIEYLWEKILLIEGETELLLERSYKWYCDSTSYLRAIPIFHFALMSAIAMYDNGDTGPALDLLGEVVAAANLINSPFGEICVRQADKWPEIATVLKRNLSAEENSVLYKETLHKYDVSDMSDGTYSLDNEDVLTYGKLLRFLRKKHNLPAQKVYSGLCSKSQFSKIENDCALPSVLLAKLLLERVGITENLFDFFGNDDEYRLMVLDEKMGVLSPFDKDIGQTLIKEMKSLEIADDKLVIQEIKFYEAVFDSEDKDKEQLFRDTLKITKEFDDTGSLSVPLTNMEFNSFQHYLRPILKNENEVEKGINYVINLIKGYEDQEYDITQYRMNLPMLYLLLSPTLFKQGKVELLELLMKKCNTPLMNYHFLVKANVHLDYYLAGIDAGIINKNDVIGEIFQAYDSFKLFKMNKGVQDNIAKRLSDRGIPLHH